MKNSTKSQFDDTLNIEKKQGNLKRGEYNDKLKVKGSFLDIMKATVKEANEKPKKKTEPKP